jgi:competence protein ComGC
MYFVLGFLVASLLALMVVPSIWKRAVRLTKKRIEAASPMTMSEFRADKDQLRAKFALSTRQLEMKIESLRTRLSEQLAEINESKNKLALSSTEYGQKTTIISELEDREKQSRERILQLEREVADLAQRLRMRDRELAERRSAPTQYSAANDRYTDDAVADIRQSLSDDRHQQQDNETDGIADNAPTSPLDQLLRETGLTTGNKRNRNERSLAETFLREDDLERLHSSISEVEGTIEADWASGEADNGQLRERLGEIASLVSRLVYAVDSEPAFKKEESLFDRVQKFAGQDLNADDAANTPSDAAIKRKRRSKAAGSVSDRMAAFQGIHANN